MSAAFSVGRLRLACVALGLTLLTFSQSSGQEAADTKLDLVVDPFRFLRNALSMWDPNAAAGQLQDQAYGYLFPMGPFFVLGKLSALSPWVVQRSWESLLLVAAFLGVVRLSRLFGVPGFWPRVAAGIAYALAPRMLMELGVISSELLPVAALPWMLIPLVRGAEAGSPRRAAARSGIAFLFASGVNASASLAILPVPALWLLTRARGPRRRALIPWWLLAVTLASLWWAVPLAVLGRYSPPFLEWIESSTVTTSTTSLIRSLRGVDHWQGYLGPSVWPAGWILAVAPAAILATTAIAALGVGGLARRATPHRLFLTSVLVVGLILVTLGHVATIGPPFAGSVRGLLDHSLAAFRNVHKFDPVVRLPIAIGLGHGLAALGRRVPTRAVLRVKGSAVGILPRSLAAIAVLGLAAVAISPALSGQIVPQTRVINDPSWWAQTGSWLGRNADGGRALVVPGAAQPAYVWGEPRDDALQPYAQGPWTVRDATPLTQPGYVRLLDRIESMLAAGRADATLAALLARSGIRYLIVRNDLDAATSQATPLRFVHATISNSPGFVLAASFGPRLVASDDPNRLVDLGLSRSVRPVEVYENTAWRSQVSLLPGTGTVVANGSSDQLPQLIAAGLRPETPVIFGSEPTQVKDAVRSATSVLTDGTRRREFGFGGVDRYSATMTSGQPFHAARAVHDYLPAGSQALSTARYSGISDVEVSSSTSAAQSGWAALDGVPSTAWVSRSVSGAIGQWIQVDLPREMDVRSIVIAFAARQSSYPTRLRVSTESGVVDDDVTPDSNTQTLQLPAGRTNRIRLTVEEMAEDIRGTQVAIAAFAIPGVLASRTVAVPGVSTADEVEFAVLPGNRSACLTVAGAAGCDPSWAAAGEEDDALDRTFRLATGATFQAELGGYLQPGPQLNNLLDAGNPVRALSSSVDSTDPRERAGAAVDGNLATGWVAKSGDPLPSIELSTLRSHLLEGIQVLPVADAPVAVPTRIQVTVGNLSYETDVPPDGVIAFPRPQTARTVRVAVVGASLRVNTDSVSGVRRFLPAGIGEIRLLGRRAPAGRTTGVVQLPCGAGPTLLLNGAAVPLHIEAAVADLLAGAPVVARPCGTGSVALAHGENRIRLAADQLWRPAFITLRRPNAESASVDPGTAQVQTWGDTSREVRVSTTAASFLSIAENANAGWSAKLDGRGLTPVTLDGWHQGWLLPAGATGVVHLEFTPQHQADWGLAVGAIAVLVLLAAALVRSRGGVQAPLPTGTGALRSRGALGAGAVGMALLGGVTGLLALAVVVVVRMRGRQWGRPFSRLPAGLELLRSPAAWPTAVLLLAGAAEAIGPANSARPLADNGGVQTLCLVAVAVLIGTHFPVATPRPAVSAQQRPLEQVVGGSGGAGGGDGREDEQREEMPAEHAPVHPMLDEDQQRQVP